MQRVYEMRLKKLSQQERELREQLLATIFPKLTDYGAFAMASIESLRGLHRMW